MLGVVKQLGYTRQFRGLDTVVVYIPGSLHLESFDQKEQTVKLHSLVSLFDSALTYGFWHQGHAKELTYIEMDKLCKEYFFFVGYLNMNVSQHFYKRSTPKYDFTCTIRLTNIGNSSYTLRLILESSSLTLPLATMELVTVCVSFDTRRPTSFPQWWKEKYGPAITAPYTPVLMTPIQKPIYSVSLPVKIIYTDTDDQGHTNWATYVRICYETLMESCIRKKYPIICEKDAKNGIRDFEMSFMRESLMGNTLDAFSWEIPQGEKYALGFEVENSDVICCQARMLLHDDSTTNRISSKL